METPKYLLMVYNYPVAFVNDPDESILEWAEKEFDGNVKDAKDQCCFIPIKLGEISG